MKIVIEKHKCQGHARCNAAAEALYKLDEDGYIASEGFDVPEGQEKLAAWGARACPERVIKVIKAEDE